MFKLLKKILGLCDHKWDIYYVTKLKDSKYYYGTIYHLRCVHCGNMKKKAFDV